jgi:hypothetical protein
MFADQSDLLARQMLSTHVADTLYGTICYPNAQCGKARS